MAGRPGYAAVDVPYLLERDAAANNATRPRREQRRLAHEYSRYEDEEDLAPVQRGFYPHLNHQYSGLDPVGARSRYEDDENLAPVQDRGFYQPLNLQYNDLTPRCYGLCGCRFHTPSPSDPADEELDYGQRARRPTHDPSPYDDAFDDVSILDHERRRGTRRHELGNHQLPFYARNNMGVDDFDEESFRDMSLDPRSPRYQRGFRESREMDPTHLYGLDPRARCRMEPHRDDYNDDIDMGPRGDRRDFGRAGVRGAGRYRTEYRLEGDFEDDDLEDRFRAPHRHHRQRLTGNRSDLDFQSVDDDIEDEYTRDLRAPTAAEIRHRRSLVQMHTELAEELDAEDQERERQEGLIEERHTEEDFEIDDVGRGLQNRRGQRSRAVGPRPTANISVDDLEDFPRGRRGSSFRPPEVGSRRNPRQHSGANGNVERFTGRNRQAPPSYDSVTPTQVGPRTQAELASDANRPPDAAAESDNASSRAATAAAAENTSAGAIKEVPRGQQHAQGPINHAKNEDNTRDGARAIDNSSNIDTVTPQRRTAQTLSVGNARTPRAEGSENGDSDSSDSGSDTPDEDSETSGVHDEDLGEGDFVRSFIHIEL